MQMTGRPRASKVAFVATATLILALTAAPASASAAPETSPAATLSPQESTSQPIHAVGYDARVAEANGFSITVDANGNHTSVAVTPEAARVQRDADAAALRDSTSAPAPQARAESNLGTCGKVWLDASKGTNDMLKAAVGFQTYMSVAEFNWTIVAAGTFSGWVQTWNGGTTTSAGWSASHTAPAIGPGTASLRQSQVDGYVILVDGTKCQTGLPGPVVGFG